MRPLILLALILPTGALSQTLGERLEALGAYPCADSGLTCVTISVPRDHFANDPEPTIAIELAVSLATEPSDGIMFYTVGGPGGSGLQVVESYVGLLDEEVQDRIDFVFFDQRGVGPVNGIDCPLTLVPFAMAPMSIQDPEAANTTARQMVADCLAEAGDPALIPYLSTNQAIRDLEAFRQLIGAPPVWLYGESYGTQFTQAYATAFPEAVRGVILDGTIDLTLTYDGFNRSFVTAAEAILDRVLAACAAEVPGCAADFLTDPATAYQSLYSRLDQGPIPVAYPLGDGGTAAREMTAALLSTLTFNALYGPDGRAELLRVLAAADRGNLIPMLRAAYATVGADPVTLQGAPDPGWFGAAYYAVTCSDYLDAGATPDLRAAAVMEEAQALAAAAPRPLRPYFEERLVCAHWPAQGPDQRPAPYAGGDWPTLILNADADPITPLSQAQSVLDQAANARMVVMEGGPHVIYGRGLACPDAVVTDLLLHGSLPEARVQTCRQDLIGTYDPLTLTDPAAATPLDLARAIRTELLWLPDLYMWDWASDLSVGCDFGGTFTAQATDKATVYRFRDCAMWPGLTLTGTVLEGADESPGDGLTHDLTVGGLNQGQIRIRDDDRTGGITITGTWNGATL